MSGLAHPLAVITGASSGIGLALTELLLERGATVLALARRAQPPEALQGRFAGRLHWQAGDVTRRAGLQALAAHAATLGPVDLLVPNAGIAQLADGLDSEAFNRQWAVNGAGALDTFAALSGRLATRASVVFIGTFLTQVTFPGLAAYIASKAALIAQARTLAVEWAAKGVRINIVSPGPTDTPIWPSLGLADEQIRAVAEAVNQRLLDGQFLSAAQVAEAVAFLLSPAASGIYGQELIVDKGYGLR